ncbi:hypothetical protein AAMO2058_000141900 [Amorphochlora amoebiformis]
MAAAGRLVAPIWPYRPRRRGELGFEMKDRLRVMSTTHSPGSEGGKGEKGASERGFEGLMVAAKATGGSEAEAKFTHDSVGYAPGNYLRPLESTPGPTPPMTLPNTANNDDGESVDMQDESYFEEYGQDLTVHVLMLQDHIRTKAYQNAIQAHRDSIRGAVVMDVGAGTGILSIFAAKAGAKRVYAVEASPMAHFTRKIVRENSMESVITVLHSKVEDIWLPGKVDVIISEWMGSMLFFESMFDSVIHARHKWLKPGGLMLPTRARLFVAPAECKELWKERIGFWDSKPYGVGMGSLRAFARKCAFSKPVLPHIKICSPKYSSPEKGGVLGRESIRGGGGEAKCDFGNRNRDFDTKETSKKLPECYKKAGVVIDINCHNATLKQVKAFQTVFEARALRDGTLHALAAWFDVYFGEQRVGTGPGEEITHWENCLMVFDNPWQIKKGQRFAFHVSMHQNEVLPRNYHIHVTLDRRRIRLNPSNDSKQEPENRNNSVVLAGIERLVLGSKNSSDVKSTSISSRRRSSADVDRVVVRRDVQSKTFVLWE